MTRWTRLWRYSITKQVRGWDDDQMLIVHCRMRALTTGTVLGGCFFTSLARVIVNGYMYHQRFVDRKALDADYLLQHINNSYTTPPRVFTVR